MKDISVIITSCDRNDLFEITLRSFFAYNQYPIKEVLVRDDSGLLTVWTELEEILSEYCPVPFRLLAPGQIGQIKSIDTLMAEVKTEYVWHSEEDWEYYKPGFIGKSLTILENDPKILTAWIRPPSDNVIAFYTDNDTVTGGIAHRFVETYEHTSGWSFNPHLMRMSDYSNFEQMGWIPCREEVIGQHYKSLGFRTAWLIEGYCKHIGWDKPTVRPGTPYRDGVIKA
jgi:hypothetical protein